MIINKTQLNEKRNEIISKLVKAGVEPTLYEVNSAIDDYFMNYRIGRPTYRPISIEAHSQSNSIEWNRAMTEIKNDFDILFKSMNNLKDNIFIREDMLDNYISYTYSNIKKLNLRIESLKKVLSSDAAYIAKSYIFNDFAGIEFYGNDDINLPYTTSFIDLACKRATSPRVTLPSGIVDLSGSTIELNGSSGINTINVYGDISSVCGNENSSVCVKQYSSTDNGATLTLSVYLQSPSYMSTVKINLNTFKDVDCKLKLTHGDGTEEELYEEQTNSICEWNFPRKDVLAFEITLIKNSADGINDGVYEYYYILNSISACDDIYELKSALVTKATEFNDPVDTIKLDVSEMIFEDTNIGYYAGIDNDSSIIDWIALEKGIDTSLNILADNDKVMSYDEGVLYFKKITGDSPSEFPDSIKTIYNGIEYTIPKKGDSYVESIDYIDGPKKTASENRTYKNESDIPDTINYSKDGYEGTLYFKEKNRTLLGYEKKEVISTHRIRDYRLWHIIRMSHGNTLPTDMCPQCPDLLSVNLRLYSQLSSSERPYKNPPSSVNKASLTKKINTYWLTESINHVAATEYDRYISDGYVLDDKYAGVDYPNAHAIGEVHQWGHNVTIGADRAEPDHVGLWVAYYVSQVYLKKVDLVDDLTKPIYSDWTVKYEGEVKGADIEVITYAQEYEKLIGGSTTNSLGCTSIGKVLPYYNKNSIKMLSGYQQWNVEILDSSKFNANYEINISDYDKAKVIGECNIDCESYKLTMSARKFVVMTTTVFCNDSVATDEKSIYSLSEDDNLQVKVYVNNMLISPNKNTGKYNLNFKKGKNKVIILLYAGNDKDKTTAIMDFNLKDVSHDIACGGVMKQVSTYKLTNKTIANDKRYFAIDEDNNIIVKYDVGTTTEHLRSEYSESDYNFQDRIRYYIKYKYLKKQYYSKCIKDGQVSINIRLMAIFDSKNSSLSAQLRNYTMLIK